MTYNFLVLKGLFLLQFANLGAAYGTYKSGVGICHLGIFRPDKFIKSVIPVVMAEIILGIYGLIVPVILNQKINIGNNYTKQKAYNHLAAGLCFGLSSLGAGFAIGTGGYVGLRALGQQDKIFAGMMLILIFAEALELYGLIVSLILAQ